MSIFFQILALIIATLILTCTLKYSAFLMRRARLLWRDALVFALIIFVIFVIRQLALFHWKLALSVGVSVSLTVTIYFVTGLLFLRKRVQSANEQAFGWRKTLLLLQINMLVICTPFVIFALLNRR